MSSSAPQGNVTFSDLHLPPRMLAALTHLKFTSPTPIQAKAIPVAITGKDVIGIAQTGTGKTLAFSVPMIEQLAKTKKRGLVILPTRELAGQVEETVFKLGRSFGVRTALLIGGASMSYQIGQLGKQPHVIIGTPGRINDHLDSGTLKLDDVGVLVLDEADRMLDMGFAPQIAQILKYVPTERQTMLFSATMPGEIVKIASRHMKMPVRVEVAQAGTVAERVNQELFIVSGDQKRRLLNVLLKQYTGTVLVFARTKYGAKKLCRLIQGLDHTAAEIHSNLSLSQRRRSLDGFKTGRFRILVATDIAARGIDVKDIELVINFDLPDNLDDYVHRVGRTGRAGKVGRAITFVMPDQRSKIRILERLVRTQLSFSPLPELPADTPFSHTPEERDSYRQRRFGHRASPRDTGGFEKRKRTSGGRGQGGKGGRRLKVHI